MNEIKNEKDLIYIKKVQNFDLTQTLDCGQCFRWSQDESGVWSGIAFSKYIEIFEKDGDIVIKGSSQNDFDKIWKDYFDLDRDYGQIIKEVSTHPTVKKAAEFCGGIRLLNQEPWEALCSFIISQNNNIPRIKGIVERLCENFGDKIKGGYTFPSAQKIAKLTLDDLAVIRSGFRAKYILDAAQKIASGEINLDALKQTDYDTARSILMGIKGVGPKVADCVLLYGLSHKNAFPRDVWINRALDQLFDGKIPESVGNYGGIVQQYIFHYIRNNQ
ncbi:MAG: DNA-3-methyladenine glycosylase 2 family protein [Clostridia bacterium]|nr:DNA-3-methyladenine glycosylase 2 family protein [Clostridia bacterium]